MTAHKTKVKREKKQSKKPLWKRQDEKKIEKKKSKRLLLIILSVFLILITLIGIMFYRMFASGNWKGRQRYNLLVGRPDDMHALISLSADEPDVFVFIFHPDFVLSGVYGYGDYKIGSLLKLGKLEGLGDDLLKHSVENTLGLKVNGYVEYKVSPDIDSRINSWLKGVIRPMAFSLIGNEIGIIDVIRYSDGVSTLREDQVEVVPLHESRYAFTVLQPDGSELYQIDDLRLDGFLYDRVKGLVYAEEDYGVSVVNTTDKSGLAKSLSRILLNSGLDVVGVGENRDKLEKTKIIVKNEEIEDSETVSFLKLLLHSYDLEVSDTEEYRADVVILIGEDYYKFLNEKPNK